jgi:hypothetical protein
LVGEIPHSASLGGKEYATVNILHKVELLDGKFEAICRAMFKVKKGCFIGHE